ncbi:hypothetical protein [Fimbriimonas ginsengisoli]|uniref:Lipocalin-like domain-containing protein n=1 Tax=Fimbriimonas ginsengisoli Gsoil 348 TaxID=661478 RepID=A0A068NVA1_FIMGI|nr:hypothetical protein [Fimbriimonas ginsengisoli]AIE87376.1 hypothetical protein OP10G_4008 [Fimbriimonas ginsengisoli Gsoil 348]
MISYKFSAVVFAVAALGTSALAQSPVGTWSGHLEMSMPAMPANTPPQQRQMATQMMAMAKKMTITLVFNKNKTYTINAKGGMVPANSKGQTGDWSQSGRTITLKSPKKPSGMGGEPQTATLSADGKTITMTPPTHGGPAAKIVFKKG